VEDEARGLLAAARPEPRTGPAAGSGAESGAGSGAGWEQVREAHAALRALAPRIADPLLRAELLLACGLLTRGTPPSA
ncbi:helix-turn-helix transcriptional regulator, partial [Streptomyces scabiei]